MKTLKLKFSTWGILTICLLLIGLQSCKKEVTTSETIKKEVTSEIKSYLMPKGFDKKTEEEQARMIESLSTEEEMQYEENLKIALYLTKIGKYEKLYEHLQSGETFTAISLEYHLTPKELKAFSNYQPSQEMKGVCTPWWHYYQWWSTGPDCLNPSTNWCCEWKGRWRNCYGLNGSYVERQHKYWNMCW